MKLTELEVSKKFLFEDVPCQKFDTENISVEVGRLELFGAENFLLKNIDSSFIFKITDSALSFAVKNFLQQNFIGVATVSKVTSTATKKFFCLRIVFFTQSVRFNHLEIMGGATFTKSDSSSGVKSFADFFQFDDGVCKNCFAFFVVPTQKVLILQAKDYKLLVRITGEGLNVRAFAEQIFYTSDDFQTSELSLQIGYGEITFTEEPKKFPLRVAEILFAVPSYIKIWNEYAEREGDFLLNRARAVGEISYKQEVKINDDKITLTLIENGNFDLSYISVGDSLEIRYSPPPYIENPALTWKDYLENFAEENRTELRFEVLRKEYSTITLTYDEKIFPEKVGKLYYSILGSEIQIDRRKIARERIEQGRSAMSNLGMILGSRLEKSSRGLGLTFQNRQKNFPMSALVREKIFSAEPTLNQVQAIDIAINTPDIAIIQGPPGTGKTTVIAAILERLNELSDKNILQAGQVLVTSLQHDAVQNIIDRLSINSLPTVKFGRRTGDKDKTIEETISTWREEILKNLDKKTAKSKTSQENSVAKKISDIVEDFYLELAEHPEKADRAIFPYNFVFASTAQQSDRAEIKRAKNLPTFGDEFLTPEYDTVIVDEAARITPGDLMIPMSQAARKIILVGDQRQLPHVYDEEIFSALREDGQIKDEGDIKISMFEQLWNRALELEKADGIKRRITLDSQFRMHPTLGNFISKNFYDIYGEGFNSPRPASDFEQKICHAPVCWINVSAKHGKDYRTANRSLYRQSEVFYIVQKLKEIFSNPQNDKLTFGVVSFYRAQILEIKREIKKLKSKLARKIESRTKIGTVDEFQGMEFDVMILSVVRSGRNFNDVDLERLRKIPRDENSLDFQKYREFVQNVSRRFYGFFNDNRLCVALSRQKKLLMVFGDVEMFNGKISARVAKICVPAMYNLLQLCKAERSIIDA